MVNSFSELIDRFGGPAAFGRAIGMTPNAAKQAKRRDSLAAERFGATIRAAEANGFHDITAERLVELAEQRGWE
jgi:hypothetical protein